MKKLKRFLEKIHACFDFLFSSCGANWMIVYQSNEDELIYTWDDNCDEDVLGSMIYTVCEDIK